MITPARLRELTEDLKNDKTDLEEMRGRIEIALDVINELMAESSDILLALGVAQKDACYTLADFREGARRAAEYRKLASEYRRVVPASAAKGEEQ